MADTRFIHTIPAGERDVIIAQLAHLSPEQLEIALAGRVCDLQEA